MCNVERACTLLANENPMDFDMISKTEWLDNQAAVTRPKMTHNLPTKIHLVNVNEIITFDAVICNKPTINNYLTY